MAGLITFIAFLIIFSLLVFIHEFGHFAAAKLSGVDVEEFAIGFGPALFQREFAGTNYAIRIIPLGGYVRMKGERGGELSKDADAYNNAKLRNKLFILFAGVFMNFVLAVVLGMVYLQAKDYQVIVQNLTEYSFFGAEETLSFPDTLQVSFILEEGPLGESQVLGGDLLLSIDGVAVESRQQILDLLSEKAGEEVTMEFVNVEDFSTYEVSTTLNTPTEEENYVLGVQFTNMDAQNSRGVLSAFYVIRYGENLAAGFNYSVGVFGYQIAALGSSINDAVGQSDASIVTDQLAGPVGVLDVVGEIVSAERLLELLNLTVLLNLALAFFNLLPLPILDGGQAVIEVFEAARGRKLSERSLNVLTYISLGVILLLFVIVMWKDLSQIGLFQSITDGLKSAAGR